MNQEHDTYRLWLGAELDGELGPAERRALDGHLAGCEACRGERRALAALGRLLAAGRVAVEADFRERVMADLPPAAWEARTRRSWLAAAVLVAILAGGAALLLGTAAEPGLGVLGPLPVLLDLLASSALAGAGLLAASWRGLGMALQEALQASPWSFVVLGVLVVAVDLLLVLLLRRAAARASRSR